MLRHALRLFALVLLSALSLQLWFGARIALMAVVDPQSTTFQRSEAWRLATERRALAWHQQWVGYDRIAPALKQAVVASEDARFVAHGGVEWDAVERAWDRNQREQGRSEQLNDRMIRRALERGRTPTPVAPKVVGGSTITQQLAKNLFLGSERTLVRKAQEYVLTVMLETLLTKRRILEIYLDNVEWGEGVFGAEAASRRYFGVGAGQLRPLQAAQLAVMLPAPKRFEKRPASAYVMGRAATVAARMGAVEIP